MAKVSVFAILIGVAAVLALRPDRAMEHYILLTAFSDAVINWVVKFGFWAGLGLVLVGWVGFHVSLTKRFLARRRQHQHRRITLVRFCAEQAKRFDACWSRALKSTVAVFLIASWLAAPVPARANDTGRILGGILAGVLTKERYNFSETEVNQLGDQVVTEIEGKYEVYTDPRVSAIGQAEAVKKGLCGVQFMVMRDQEKNACSVPSSDGGVVYIASSYLALLDDNALAFVLGHELGHLVNKDAQSALRRAGERNGIILGLALATGANQTLRDIGDVTNFFIANRYSQKQEARADDCGLELTAAIGSDPFGAIDAFEKLKNGTETPRWVNDLVGSHPRLSDRQKAVAKKVSQPQQLASAINDPPLGPTVVVVVDPEASDSYGYGFGRGYYYSEDLSRVAKKEAETALGNRGFSVLVSTQDVVPLQQELELENSQWGQYGDGRKDIGYFAGADYVFYVSAHVLREQNFQVGDWRRQAEVAGLRVGVLLRMIDHKTRRQLEAFAGSDSGAGISRVHLPLGRSWDPLEVNLEQASNLGQQVIGGAVRKALSKMPSASTAPVVVPVSTLSPANAGEWVTPQPLIDAEGSNIYFAEAKDGQAFIRRSDESLLLTAVVPLGTSKVVFVISDGDKKVFRGEANEPPFQIRVTPNWQGDTFSSLKLTATALDVQGIAFGQPAEIVLKSSTGVPAASSGGPNQGGRIPPASSSYHSPPPPPGGSWSIFSPWGWGTQSVPPPTRRHSGIPRGGPPSGGIPGVAGGGSPPPPAQ
ncbi:MAG: M48 family metalloprotease [Candidatus Berkelbacteria bacterium]|nr:M48 family metalloprotease [Candidatus Berkelbacteria bacterium]